MVEALGGPWACSGTSPFPHLTLAAFFGILLCELIIHKNYKWLILSLAIVLEQIK